MSRIMAIDYGQKRVGIAVTDEGQIIATALDTVHVKDIFAYLKQYLEKENVSSFVVGDPKRLNNTPSESVRFVDPFVKKLKKEFPAIPVERYDERFTSKMAFQSMIDMGMKKKDRREKANIDKISAVILLQSYMNYLAGNR